MPERREGSAGNALLVAPGQARNPALRRSHATFFPSRMRAPCGARRSSRVDLVDGVLYLLRVMAGWGTPCSSRAFAWRAAAGLLAASVVACGGAAPLLHPAHALPIGTVSAGAGVSSLFASDSIDAAIASGRSAAAQPPSDAASAQAYATGVLAQALVGPGASPWIAARVGLPDNVEAGLTYVGRSFRLDGRYVRQISDAWALSLGLGASAILFSPDSSTLDESSGVTPAPPGDAEFELDGKGWGADLPILIGYESLGGFFEVWGGLRFGYETLSGELLANEADPASPRIDASGNRLWASGLAGFSLGVPPIWFRFEVATTAHRVSGEVGPFGAMEGPGAAQVELSGWSFSPSGALVGKF